MTVPAVARVDVSYLFTDHLDAAVLSQLTERLNAEERGRAFRLVRPERRIAFVAAHALLQDRLGVATGRQPWRTRAEPGGRPILDPPQGDPPLRFSLTHADGLVAVALARACEVGVDAERLEEGRLAEGRADPALIAGCLSTREAEVFAATPPRQAARHFLQVWTAKEAVLKAAGLGLARAPQDLTIILDPPGVRPSSPLPVEGAWTLHWRDLPDHVLCVASCGDSPVEVAFEERNLADILASVRSPAAAVSRP